MIIVKQNCTLKFLQRTKQLDLERDCRIRNKDHLDRLLLEHQERYKRNLSARDEQALVTEIDALKRNKKLLEYDFHVLS